MVTCARTRGSGMMVLPVTWATASMTWPISTSRKLGVMRWPLFWALTTPTATRVINPASRLTRIAHRVIPLTIWLFIGLLLFFPGLGIGRRRLVHGDSAIATGAELVGFIGDLGEIEHQFLLSSIARDADPG